MHPAMKHVAAVRKKLGIRTIFNLLGPAGQSGRGPVPTARRRPARTAAAAGRRARPARHATHAGRLRRDGLDEVTLAGPTHVTEVTAKGTREFTWQPEDFGINRAQLDSLTVDGPAASAAMIRDILAGEHGPPRDIVVLNAAAGLIAAGKTDRPKQAAELAAAAIDSGAAAELLDRLASRSHQR